MGRMSLAALVILAMTAAAHAQRSTYQQMRDFNQIINNRINNDMMMKNMCEGWRKKGQTVPAECGKYGSSGAPSAATPAPAASSVRFTPVAGDTAMQQFADRNGSDAREKQFMLQVANAAKTLFEERYASKGWTNNLAGALAFFIISNMTVYTGKEPGEASQQVLFQALDATLSQSSEFSSTSNADKQALYNTLIAYSGAPVIFYADAAKKGDTAGLQKARTLAAGYIKMFLNAEPDSLQALVR